MRIRVTDSGWRISRRADPIFEPFFTTSRSASNRPRVGVCHHHQRCGRRHRTRVVDANRHRVPDQPSDGAGTRRRGGADSASRVQRGRCWSSTTTSPSAARSAGRVKPARCRRRRERDGRDEQLQDGERSTILCDIMMPEMNGQQFFARVQSSCPSKPSARVHDGRRVHRRDTRLLVDWPAGSSRSRSPRSSEG